MLKKTVLLFAITFCVNNSFAQLYGDDKTDVSKKIVLGITDSIQSTILSETRIINICLPEDYSADSVNRYPVIYLLDGGVEEDFIHITGLVKFFTTSWVNRFSKSIIVGIENINRRKDFTFATPNLSFVSKMGFDTAMFKEHGGSEKFISFIEKELQPFIQTRYRTGSSKTIIGESLAGLLATEILIKKPALFDTYIISSPSLWWGSGSLLKERSAMSETTFHNKLNIYIAAGSRKEDPATFNYTRNLAAKINKYAHAGIKVYLDYLPDETHATILHQAVYNAFKLIYPTKNN